MKKRTLVLGLAALCLSFGSMAILGGVSSNIGNNTIVTKAEDAETTTITFGSSSTTTTNWKVSKSELTFSDVNKTTWTIDAAFAGGTASYTNKSASDTADAYCQVGSSSNNITSFNLTGDASDGYLITSVTVRMAGFSSQSGSASISADETEVGSGEWTKTTVTDITSSAFSSDKVTISVPASAKTFKIYSLSYTFKLTPSVSVDGDKDALLKAGGEKDLALVIKNKPEGGSVTATTGDSSIATASITDSTLKITAVAAGTTTYTVSVKDSAGNSLASCTGNITVSSAISGISITSDDFNTGDSLKLGKSYQLIAAASPSGASNEVTWSSGNDAAIVSESGLLKIVSNSSDTITITATSTVDASVSGTIAFSIDPDSYNLSISDLISNDGKTFANSIKDDTTVMTKGTITAIDGTSAYIQSGSSAIYVHTSSDAFSSFEVGDGVKVSGAVKINNSQAEIVPASVEADDTAKEEINSLELGKASLISANTSRLAKATKAVCLESKAISTATGATSVKFKFADTVSDSSEFVAYFRKSDLATMSGIYGDFDKGEAYNLSGIFYNYVGSSTTPRLVIGASFGSYTNQNLLDFITDYIDGQDSHGSTCAAKYAAASAALANLGANTQTAFKTATAYNSAYEIYRYWELNQTSVSTAKLVASSNTSDWGNAALIAGAFILVGGATFFFIHNNRKKQDR